MNENENGFQSSPGSPEPPVRENVPNNPERVLVTQADTSGLDIAGEASLGASHAPVPSSERTESFSSARAGDTGNMFAGMATTAQAENASVPARQQNPAVRNLESGYASQPAPQAGYAPRQAPQAQTTYASQQAQRTYVAPQETSTRSEPDASRATRNQAAPP